MPFRCEEWRFHEDHLLRLRLTKGIQFSSCSSWSHNGNGNLPLRTLLRQKESALESTLNVWSKRDSFGFSWSTCFPMDSPNAFRNAHMALNYYYTKFFFVAPRRSRACKYPANAITWRERKRRSRISCIRLFSLGKQWKIMNHLT